MRCLRATDSRMMGVQSSVSQPRRRLRVEGRGIGNQPVLEHFGVAGLELARVQGLQKRGAR